MERKSTALAIVAVGMLMVLVALLADALGIGAEGFGWRRGVFLAAGVVVAIAGIAYLMAPARARDAVAEQPPSPEQPPPADDR